MCDVACTKSAYHHHVHAGCCQVLGIPFVAAVQCSCACQLQMPRCLPAACIAHTITFMMQLSFNTCTVNWSGAIVWRVLALVVVVHDGVLALYLSWLGDAAVSLWHFACKVLHAHEFGILAHGIEGTGKQRLDLGVAGF